MKAGQALPVMDGEILKRGFGDCGGDDPGNRDHRCRADRIRKTELRVLELSGRSLDLRKGYYGIRLGYGPENCIRLAGTGSQENRIMGSGMGNFRSPLP